ncbi:MAG: tyrosine-protein phosphatase [Tannerellaceae bacterium]|jgi:protein-tyrosine phosphatase|nr:tyrosine-protein phosphatase [Tannerellaceae bacterium]
MKKILLFAAITSLAACFSMQPEINTACQQDSVGNYLIKWETYPKLKGKVQVYASDDPDLANASSMGYTPIKDGVTKYITTNQTTRKYFRLVFNKTHQAIVAARIINMDSTSHIRDIGGYLTREKKNVRWGKVFRMGTYGKMSAWDSMRIRNLQIKTIIDLRMDSEALANPISYPDIQVIALPVTTTTEYVTKQALNGRFRTGDASLYLQDMFLQFTEQIKPFANAMTVLADQRNYPIIIIDPNGKDAAGYLSALLLATLNVSDRYIVRDYLSGTEAVNFKRYAHLVVNSDNDIQETLTTILSTKDIYINLALNKIKSENETYANYLREKLNISDKQQEKIRQIMLYQGR